MLHPAKSKIATKQKSDLLYKAILMLETEEECYNFFQDLCTISEMRRRISSRSSSVRFMAA